jgi:hypothetical protein
MNYEIDYDDIQYQVQYQITQDTTYDLFNISENTLINTLSLFSSAEFFTIIFMFNFLQLLILTVLSELIWPTQLFNRQNTIGFTSYRLRTYTETIVKLRGFTLLYKLFNKAFVKFN